MAFLGRTAGTVIPRVVTASVSSPERRLPEPGTEQSFLVRLREEGTCVAWQHDVVLTAADARALAEGVATIDAWTRGTGSTPATAARAATAVGRRLYDVFLGPRGTAYLAAHPPTALMVDVDETLIGLPWELLRDRSGVLAERMPFGRLVTTRLVPTAERDPAQEDPALEVLAVLDPSGGMPGIDAELAALKRLHGQGLVRLDVLRGANATTAAFRRALEGKAYDVLHVSAHGAFDSRSPSRSELVLADGVVTAKDIAALPWAKPPYLVVTGACWSARAAGGARLFRRGSGANGLAAAFLGAGTAAVTGWFWPVSMRAATEFACTFYDQLMATGTVGEAFRSARTHTVSTFADSGDLSGSGAILYGDAATGERRNLAAA